VQATSASTLEIAYGSVGTSLSSNRNGRTEQSPCTRAVLTNTKRCTPVSAAQRASANVVSRFTARYSPSCAMPPSPMTCARPPR
jgi:hypothetical protein